MTVETRKETLGFQAEIKELLRLMIHSLYSHSEIFLRELISNASDACDKLKFEALTDAKLYENDPELAVTVTWNEKTRTLSVRDNGIGMSRDEVVENIGTIARSGTRRFIEAMSGEATKDMNLIGQFGVGFYSSFIVADRVTLFTRRAGKSSEEGVRWESAGEGDYTLENVDRPERGTEIVLHLRDEHAEYCDGYRLKTLIRKYSDHIGLPVRLIEEGKAESETVNQAGALWAKPRQEITEEQYHEFYKRIAHDSDAPLVYAHNHVEGRQNYTSLLFIPSRAPFDLWDRDHHRGLKLYVRLVFIMDDAESLLPHYLRFVRGIIDAQDLPLNISREILQANSDIDAIRAACVKRILGLIEELSESKDDRYNTFWSQFGQVLKEGVGEDFGNREKIASLLRFASTRQDTQEQVVSLDDYLSRMIEGQEKIYYVTADSFLAAKNSPHLEVFRKKGIEVLLLTDRVDEWLVAHLTEYKGKTLQSVTKGELDASASEPEQGEGDRYKALTEKLGEALKDQVRSVRISRRLTESAACLVADEHEMGAHLERLLKAAGQEVSASKPHLEINPDHPLIKRFELAQGEDVADFASVIHDQALLSEGGQLEDPAGFVRKFNRLLLN